MESIPGYDDWKTTPPDDPEPASVCDCCGCEVYEGDYIYTIDGERLCDCKWSQGCEIELQGTGCHETDADHIYR